MALVLNTGYSVQRMVSDGTLSTVALGLQYLQRDDIFMRIAGEETPQSGAPSGYTWTFIDNTTLKILPTVPNGVEVVVYRRTDVDTMYNVYSQNAQFDESTIDENNTQLLFIAQEYLEQGATVGIDTIEYLRDDGSFTYYRLKRTDGSYSDEFAVPSAGSITKVLAREALRRSYAVAGLNLVDGSFQTGFTLVNANDVALDEVSGKAFSGAAGAYPPRTSTTSFTDESTALIPESFIFVDMPPFNGDLDAAINSVTGNTVFILGLNTYVSDLWSGINRNNKVGIKIIGSGVPQIDYTNKRLIDGTGTIIRGSVQNSAAAFECHNLGIDMGDHTRTTHRGGVYEDALVNYAFGDNADIRYGNLVILESECIDGNPTSYTHCHLAEIGSGVTVTGPIEMVYGGHGYVVKCKDFRADGQRITVYGQRLDSWIVKSDALAKAEQVHMGHVHCGKVGFTTRTGFVEGHSANSTDGIYFDSLTGSHNEGLLQGAAGSTGFVTDVHIPVISNAVSYGSDYNIVIPNEAVDWHIGTHEFNQCSGGLKVEAGAANILIGDGIVKGSTTHGYELSGDYQHGNLVAKDNSGFGVNRGGGDGLNVDRISGVNNGSGLVNSIPSAISGFVNGWAAKVGYRFSVDVVGRTIHIRGRLDQSAATAGSIAIINALYRPTSPCVLMATGLKSGGETFPILATVETDGRIEIGLAYTAVTGGIVDITGSYTF